MPAPKSILRKETNSFAPVDNTIKILRKCMALSGKMPKRKRYIGEKIVQLSGEVMENAKSANAIYATNNSEATIRTNYWTIARARLKALSTWINIILETQSELTYRDESGRTKGVKIADIEEVSNLINEEMKLLTDVLSKEHKK